MLTTTGPGGISPVHATTKLYPINSEHSAPVQPEEPLGKFDSIELSPAPEGERRFYMDLVSRISKEVRTATTTGDIQSYRAQIHSGQYAPDATAIAARMLLLGDG